MQPFQPVPGPFIPMMAPPVKKKIRWGMVITGIIIGVLGIVTMIGGAVASLASQTASSIDPIAEARAPGTATFTAEKATYNIMQVRERGESRSVSGYRCTVTLADGRTIAIDGSRQSVSTESPGIQSIGSFDATPGPTSVHCENENGNTRFVVDDESAVERWLPYILGAGGALLFIAAGLILFGIFRKKTVTPAM